MRWVRTTKADQRCRVLADRHYSRQTPGHPMWTRPGYVMILYCEQRNGRAAVWCWWRPKWEDGRPGLQRKDGLRAIECTMFRNETRWRSSDLIRDAVALLATWAHAIDVAWPDGLVTGINSVATAAGRHPSSRPGECFLQAGWKPFPHRASKRADTWLRYVPPCPACPGGEECGL